MHFISMVRSPTEVNVEVAAYLYIPSDTHLKKNKDVNTSQGILGLPDSTIKSSHLPDF